jgi:hypothetical protein
MTFAKSGNQLNCSYQYIITCINSGIVPGLFLNISDDISLLDFFFIFDLTVAYPLDYIFLKIHCLEKKLNFEF